MGPSNKLASKPERKTKAKILDIVCGFVRMPQRAFAAAVTLLMLCAHSARPVAAWVNNWDGPLDYNCGSGGVYYFQVSCEVNKLGIFSHDMCAGVTWFSP